MRAQLDPAGDRRVWTGRLLGLLSLAYLASAAIAGALGSYSLRLGPFRLSSQSPPRDLLIAAAAGLLAWRLRPDAVNRWCAAALRVFERAAPYAAAAAALAIVAVGLYAGSFCACGADSYGYVSEAALWARGTLHVPIPLASTAPWSMAEWTFAPLGYRPAIVPGYIVPTYAPGLPLLMALAFRLTHTPSAVFIVIPAMGAVAVWCTFLLGRQLGGPVTGASSALLLACSATFLLHVIIPMSDVPNAAWWLVAMVLLWRATTASAWLGGLACSAALLTRPNLIALTAVAAILPVTAANGGPTARTRRLLWFLLGAAPGPIAVAWIQRSLYGSVTATGYGRLRDVYTFTNMMTNARLYPQWLSEIYGPFIFIGLISPIALIAGRRNRRLPAARFIAFALLFAAGVYASYLPYEAFNNWTYSRFMLPAIPLLLILGVWTVFAGARRLGPVPLVYATIGLAFLAAMLVGGAEARGIFLVRRGNLRNIGAARYIGATTPPGTLVLSMHHSGSVRYYGGRTTVRYDSLEPQELDTAILAMHRMQRGPVLLLDDWEEARFRQRFHGQRWGALDWPPRLEITTQPAVRLYDPSDRDRFFARESIQTTRIEGDQLEGLVSAAGLQ